MSSKIRNGKCTGQNLPFSLKATINKKIWQQFHSNSSGSSHKQLPRSKIQQDLQSNWLLEHAELLHTTALVLEWTGLNLATRVTLGNKYGTWADLHSTAEVEGRGAQQANASPPVKPLPAASAQHAGFLMWVLHPP